MAHIIEGIEQSEIIFLTLRPEALVLEWSRWYHGCSVFGFAWLSQPDHLGLLEANRAPAWDPICSRSVRG